LILAIRFGIPFLAVPYDPKVRGLYEDIGYPLPPLWTPGTRSTPQQAAELAGEAWARRDELGALLRAASGTMRTRAERNFEVLATLAGRPA
jgi:polysaccharide pyruvyl transferase WcaK-like protein